MFNVGYVASYVYMSELNLAIEMSIFVAGQNKSVHLLKTQYNQLVDFVNFLQLCSVHACRNLCACTCSYTIVQLLVNIGAL